LVLRLAYSTAAFAAATGSREKIHFAVRDRLTPLIEAKV